MEFANPEQLGDLVINIAHIISNDSVSLSFMTGANLLWIDHSMTWELQI